MRPGDSARSHTADEYIYLAEISDGIIIYIDLLESIFPYLANNPEPDLHTYESQHR
jgi:acetylornithine deacetylase